MNMFLELSRSAEVIDRILDRFVRLVFAIFSFDGYMRQIINLIMSNQYLLISVSLVIIGFVIGIIKRIISV